MHKIPVTVQVLRTLETELELNEQEYNQLKKNGEISDSHLDALEKETLSAEEGDYGLALRTDWIAHENGEVLFNIQQGSI